MAEPSSELQLAILTALNANAAVSEVVEGRIFDGRPSNAAFPNITFGPSDVLTDDMSGIVGHIETLQLDCWVRDGNRVRPAKELNSKVKRALHDKPLALGIHALANLQVVSTRAFLDRDGLTGHGIVTIEATIEERS